MAKMERADIKLAAQIGGAMALTVVFVGFGVVIWRGPWREEHQSQQLDLLGWGMIASAFLILVALVAITEIALNFKASRGGIEASMDQEETKTTVKTEVEVSK